MFSSLLEVLEWGGVFWMFSVKERLLEGGGAGRAASISGGCVEAAEIIGVSLAVEVCGRV